MKTPLALFFFLTCILVYGQTPRLVVPVGHTGEIISSAVSPDGKQVLTGSKDKTAKLWDSSGRLLQTFVGHTAQVNAVAFSPDGKLVLTGSNDKKAILWDLSGNILQTFTGHNDYINYVAFSQDGKKVLTAGWDETAKLWDLSGRMLLEFKKYRIPTPKIPWYMGKRKSYRKMRHLFFLADDKKNVLVNLDDDGETRILADASWGVEYYKNYGMRHLKMQKDSLVRRVPSSQRLDLFRSYSQRDSVNDKYTSKTVREITSVGFTSDKKFIVLGCGCVDHTERALDVLGRKVQTIDSTSTEWKAALSSSGDNSEKLWVFSGRMSRSFKLAKIKAFSPDHKNLLTVSKNNTAKLWDSSGKMLFQRIPNNKETTSVVFSPDGKTILIGGWDFTPLQKAESRKRNGAVFMADRDNSQELWDLSGQVMQSFKGLGFENKAAFSPACPNDPNGGGIILTTNEEMTSNLWDTKSGKLLATLFMLDSTDWVVTSPSGLFDASPGAMNLMYFVVGLEVIELEQLKERYYEPGLLAKLMGFSKEPIREVEGFDSVALYPKVRLELDTLQNKLHIHLTPRNGGVGKVSVFINDKEIIENANPLPRGIGKTRDTAITIELDKYARYFLFDTLNTVSIRAYNEAGWLKSAAQSVEYQPVFAKAKGNNDGQGANDESSLKKRIPSLHILVVGSADYAGTDLDLKYAAKDARDMASALEQIGRQMFIPWGGEVTVHLLSTDTNASRVLPTKANIKAAFEDIKNDDKAEDVVIVYFSGHGITYGDADRALFYYLTRDIGGFDLSDAGIREKRAISSEELTKWLNDTHARKQVLILDACNSGKMVEVLAGKKELSSSQIRALDRMKDRTGMFVLAGSAADKVSYEAGQYGQGLLTYSLLQGIKGLAHSGDERVDVMKLFQYSCDEVPELAKGIGGIQTPMLVGPLKGSFDIGIKNDSVQITIAEPKPVFIRNVFLDEDNFDDALGLTNALKEYFNELTARGGANLIYVDVSEYENAYSIKGLYNISGNAVTVRGRLFLGKESKGEFSVTGQKDNLPELIKTLLGKVSEML